MRHLYLKTFFKRYDGTICISESLMEVARQYNPLRRHLKVPIMVRGNLSTAKHDHERPYIFHGGSMSERKDAIIETMRGFAIASSRINNQLDFILAGPPSPHIEELNSIIQANHLFPSYFDNRGTGGISKRGIPFHTQQDRKRPKHPWVFQQIGRDSFVGHSNHNDQHR